MIAIRLYQKKNKLRADGKAPIYFVLAKGSERKYIATKKSIEPSYFDNRKGIVTKGADNSIKLNAFFKRRMTDLDDIVIDLMNAGKEVTFDKIEQIFNNKYTKDFIAFAFEELKLQKGLIAEKTRDGYRERLNSLKQYAPELPFNQVNHDFLLRYKHYLVNIKKRMTNGIYQDFAAIKKFWFIAIAKGEVTTNPFKNFSLSTEETIKNWHPREELLKLDNLLKMEGLASDVADRINDLLKNGSLTTKETNAFKHFLKIQAISDAIRYNLAHYLFSCFSGLRLGDKRIFTDKNVVNDRISVKTSKTGKPIVIPFNDQARELLSMVLARPLKKKGNRVNSEIRICMLLAGIDKHITYHCSRHTFAINCILLGIDLITVRDWLGHRSVTTTEIYAKIAQQYKDENMKKFNNFYKS